MNHDSDIFQTHRRAMLALAYRMLGDLARAEDTVQEAWLRWESRHVEVGAPKAFLLTTVTRLCLDELGTARARREESRGDRLPEPVVLDEGGLENVEVADQVSMAFLVLLQRLTPAERAVFLLHEVFDLGHAEIGALLGKNEEACRQLLSRGREHVAAEKRVFQTSPEEHKRLLMAFVGAVTRGDEAALIDLLAEDAVLIADAGPKGGSYGRIRNVGRPVVGRTRIVAAMKASARQDVPRPDICERLLNGEPAAVAFVEGRAIAAILVSVADGKIRHVFMQTDPDRLRHVGPRSSAEPATPERP
jgi:RNA polymerase sigma-70 factor (ECF subfamily)